MLPLEAIFFRIREIDLRPLIVDCYGGAKRDTSNSRRLGEEWLLSMRLVLEARQLMLSILIG